MTATPVYISTDSSELDVEFIHNYLSKTAYWSKGRSLDDVKTSIANSFCFGVYDEHSKQQIGFARVTTDYVVFAWIMDLFIDAEYRGLGYAKKLVKAILDHKKLKKVNGFGLRTEDAHGLYSQFGFSPITKPATWMFKKNSP